ncbi:uncharacterized protein [Nicotiana sylvestris]|uniref:uncharacterized protein n=1 Tax=Nicotiana sylvestris TaxID=4096 RepID=UPI00388CAB20
MSLKIKEEVTKQIKAKVLRVVEYPTCLANIVSILKKDRKVKILLSEFDIVYVTQKAVKGQALVDHLIENSVGGEYEPLKMYFPDEEVSFVREDITESYEGWRMFFDGAANFKGVGIGAVFVCAPGARRMGYQELQDIVISAPCAGIEKEQPDKNYIDPIPVRIYNQSPYCAHVDEEADGKPWFHDIKEYLSKGEYPEHATHIQKRTLRRLSNHFFHIRGNFV